MGSLPHQVLTYEVQLKIPSELLPLALAAYSVLPGPSRPSMFFLSTPSRILSLSMTATNTEGTVLGSHEKFFTHIVLDFLHLFTHK